MLYKWLYASMIVYDYKYKADTKKHLQKTS